MMPARLKRLRAVLVRSAALAMLWGAISGGSALAAIGVSIPGRPVVLPPATGGVVFPQSGAWLGAYTGPIGDGGFDRASRMSDFEALVGHDLAMERVYYMWDDIWPTADDYYTRDQGRIPVISWGAAWRNGGYVKWADISRGQYDDSVDARAADIKAFGQPLVFVFQHEPDLDDPSGTPAEFVQAFRHIHDRFVADGVTNVSYGTVLLAYDYRADQGDLFYPGDDYVDVLGADGYNWVTCNGRGQDWMSFSEIFSDFHDYAVAHGKPMLIAEWGSIEDPAAPNRKASWYTGAATTVKSWPEVKGLSYYNVNANCDWLVDTSSASLSSFKALSQDPYFDPSGTGSPATSVGAYADVQDNVFKPVAGVPAQGRDIQWLFEGANSHNVTDNTGMSSFGSGTKKDGDTYAFTFVAAGTYPYTCTLHSGMTGKIKIPVVVSPVTGGVTASFTVTWASGPAAAGYNYDVQIQRPHQTKWSGWKTDQSGKSATFVPDSGTGTYSFRARIQKTSTGKASWYSASFSITVTS